VSPTGTLFLSVRHRAGQGGELRLHVPHEIPQSSCGRSSHARRKDAGKGLHLHELPSQTSLLSSISSDFHPSTPLPHLSPFPPSPLLCCSHFSTLAKFEWDFQMVTAKGIWLVPVRPQVLLQASKVPEHTVDLLQEIFFLFFFPTLGRTIQVPHIFLPRTAEPFGKSIIHVPLAALGKET